MTYLYTRVNSADMEYLARRLNRLEQLGGSLGIEALHDYYSDLAEALNEPIELDIIQICGEWSYFINAKEAEKELGALFDEIRRDYEVLELPSGGVLIAV